MPSYATLAQPWSQLSVAANTQTPLWDAILSELGPCGLLHCPTAGMYVVPVVQLVWSLGAWLVFPSPSYWLIQTIKLSYVIQFAQRPPKIRGIQFTSRLGKDAPALRAEIATGEECNRAGPSN